MFLSKLLLNAPAAYAAAEEILAQSRTARRRRALAGAGFVTLGLAIGVAAARLLSSDESDGRSGNLPRPPVGKTGESPRNPLTRRN